MQTNEIRRRLSAGATAALAAARRVEPRHAVAGGVSVLLHVLMLALWPAPAPVPPEEVTFEVVTESLPPEIQKKRKSLALKDKKPRPKKPKPKRRSKPREPNTLEARFQLEKQTSRALPEIDLPRTEALNPLEDRHAPDAALSAQGKPGAAKAEAGLAASKPAAAKAEPVASAKAAESAPDSVAQAGKPDRPVASAAESAASAGAQASASMASAGGASQGGAVASGLETAGLAGTPVTGGVTAGALASAQLVSESNAGGRAGVRLVAANALSGEALQRASNSTPASTPARASQGQVPGTGSFNTQAVPMASEGTERGRSAFSPSNATQIAVAPGADGAPAVVGKLQPGPGVAAPVISGQSDRAAANGSSPNAVPLALAKGLGAAPVSAAPGLGSGISPAVAERPGVAVGSGAAGESVVSSSRLGSATYQPAAIAKGLTAEGGATRGTPGSASVRGTPGSQPDFAVAMAPIQVRSGYGAPGAASSRTAAGSSASAPEARQGTGKDMQSSKAELDPIMKQDSKLAPVAADILGAACPIGFGHDMPAFTFPRLAMWQGITSGSVVVRAEILPSGRTKQIWIKISSGYSQLDDDAKNQVSRHVFQVSPEQKASGRTFWVDIPIHYKYDAK